MLQRSRDDWKQSIPTARERTKIGPNNRRGKPSEQRATINTFVVADAWLAIKVPRRSNGIAQNVT